MKTKALALAFLVVACSLVAIILNRRPRPEGASQQQQPVSYMTAPPVAPAIVREVQPPPEQPKPEVFAVQDRVAPTEAVRTTNREPAIRTNTSPAVVQAPTANNPKTRLEDPLARVALAYVGEDPDAEAYWMAAIFDTNLPDGERDDLMEDLNEVGFADPQHPGPQDLPLIENRIAVIESIAPYASPFMLRHLGEAWKDLNNMESQVLSGQ